MLVTIKSKCLVRFVCILLILFILSNSGYSQPDQVGKCYYCGAIIGKPHKPGCQYYVPPPKVDDSNNPNSAPTYEEQEAKRKKEEADRKAKEEAEKKAREEAEALRKKLEEEKREKEKQDALKRMKGTSSQNLGLKPTTNSNGTVKDNSTPIFGLKPIKETGIEKKAPDKDTRDVTTGWKRLHCAFDILNYIPSHIDKIQNGSFGPEDLSEIKYLAGEVSNALNGNQLGVQCNTSNIPPSPKEQFDMGRQKQFYTKMMNGIIRQAEKYYAAIEKQKSLQLREQQGKDEIEKLKKEIDDLKVQQSSKTSSVTTPSYDKEKDKQNINKVFEEQKRNEQIKQKQDAMALALAAQKAVQKERAEQAALITESTKNLNRLSAIEKKSETPNSNLDELDKLFDDNGNAKSPNPQPVKK